MIKIILTFILFSLISQTAFASKKTPSSESGLETGIDFRVLKKKKRFILLAETRNRKELLDTNYHQLMLGSYYRITKRFRTGLFFQGEKGLRWDTDWSKGTTWGWNDINSRWDFSTVLDATYTDTIKSNWVWEFKNRLSYYHSRDALLFRTRPGIRYFILKEGQPLWQLYSEVEAYVPLNYGSKKLYEYWIYFGSLYQFSKKFSLGPVLSYRQRWFHSYDSFQDKTGQNYTAQFSSLYIGLSALYVW